MLQLRSQNMNFNFLSNDLQFVRTYFIFCNIIGLFPWCLNRKAYTLVFSRCYIVLVIVSFLFGMVVSLYARITFGFQRMEPHKKVEDILQLFVDYCFSFAILYGIVGKVSSWRIIFKDLARLDTRLKRKCFCAGFHKTYHALNMVMCHGAHLSVILLVMSNWNAQQFYYYSFHMAIRYCQAIFVMFLFELTSALRRRYIHMSTQITGIFVKASRWEIYERNIYNEIMDVKLTYTILYNIVRDVNIICGPNIFFIFGSLLVNILNNFNWIFGTYETNFGFHVQLDTVKFILSTITLYVSK